MANLFIGFPVPRAKIADMIDGAAPPLEHKTQHQDGGDDEMDLTGLEGAGGVAFPLRGIWADDYTADHARWRKTYTGSGALSRTYDELKLGTGSTNPSTASLYLRPRQPIVTPTWQKKRHLILQAALYSDVTADALIWIQTGYYPSTNSIGFHVDGAVLYSLCHNGSGDAWHSVHTFAGGSIDENILLEAIHFPAEKVEFWVNGVLEHTETSKLPTGTPNADYLFYLKVDNRSTTSEVDIDFSHIQIYQEA